MTTFYVDAQAGNDAGTGRSSATAWRTLTKASGAKLAPGDEILLKRGSVFDTMLQLSGDADSGTASAPIRVGTYGSGAAPVIDGGPAQKAGIWVYNARYVEIDDVTVRDNRIGVRLENASNVTVESVDALGNTDGGLSILRDASSNNTIIGGSYVGNGSIQGDGTDNLGSGISLFGKNHVVRDVELAGNAEHGSIVYGTGHVFQGVTVSNNGEGGVFFKAGSHEIKTSQFFGNKTNAAVSLDNGASLVKISGSSLSSPAEINRYTLQVVEGRVESEGNRYEGSGSHLVFIGSGADGGSNFDGDLFYGKSVRSNLSLLRIEGGQGHVVDEGTFVAAKSGALGVDLRAGSLRVEDSSWFAQNGLLLNWAGGTYDGDRNTFARASGSEYVRVKGTGYREADIDSDKLARDHGVEANSTTPVLDGAQLVAAWPGGATGSGGGTGDGSSGGSDPGGGSGGGSDPGGGGSGGGDPGGSSGGGTGSGVVWTGGSGNDSYTGTEAADRLDGAAGDDRLEGLGGDDTLIGGSGRDQLLGGAGDDLLRGDNGNDTLTGGPGNDRIEAGFGTDRVVVARNEGVDVVTEKGGSGDRIEFSGIARSEASFANDGGDLVVTIGTGSVTAEDHFASSSSLVESFVFADGTLSAGDVALLV